MNRNQLNCGKTNSTDCQHSAEMPGAYYALRVSKSYNEPLLTTTSRNKVSVLPMFLTYNQMLYSNHML